MAKRLADYRNHIQTVEAADAQFAQLAKAEIAIARIDAEAEAKIAQVKATAEAAKDHLREQVETAQKHLAAFIESHPEHFSKPRKRATEWGRYGLHTATKVKVFDKDAAILHCECNGLADCLKTTITLQTGPVGKLLKDDIDIPGCELQTGDVANFTVKKELLDQAKEGAE